MLISELLVFVVWINNAVVNVCSFPPNSTEFSSILLQHHAFWAYSSLETKVFRACSEILCSCKLRAAFTVTSSAIADPLLLHRSATTKIRCYCSANRPLCYLILLPHLPLHSSAAPPYLIFTPHLSCPDTNPDT